MARASREQAGQSRDRIISAASALFRERGVETVSISDLMTAAGMTVGGFYKHFDSREAVVAEALALAFRQAGRTWQQMGEDAAKSARLEDLVRHYFAERPSRFTCPILALAPHAGRDGCDAGTADLYSAGVEALFQQFRQLAEEAAGAGGDACVAGDRTLVLFAAMIGTGMLARGLGPGDLVRALQAAVLRQVAEQAAEGAPSG